VLLAPPDVDLAAVRSDLEQLATELMVELILEQP
jgi:glycine cleavage system regulatory protein